MHENIKGKKQTIGISMSFRIRSGDVYAKVHHMWTSDPDNACLYVRQRDAEEHAALLRLGTGLVDPIVVEPVDSAPSSE